MENFFNFGGFLKLDLVLCHETNKFLPVKKSMCKLFLSDEGNFLLRLHRPSFNRRSYTNCLCERKSGFVNIFTRTSFRFISIFNSMNCLFLQVCLFLPRVFPKAFVLSSRSLGELVRAELKTEAGGPSLQLGGSGFKILWQQAPFRV